jgi:hypothetical protein
MTQEEKDRILALLGSDRGWCQEAEARDGRGSAVRHSDAAAVAWDLTGALCHLFGWDRAMLLFPQLARHLTGRRPPFGRHWAQPQDPQMASMAALQDYNDQPTTDHESMMARLAVVRVCRPRKAAVVSPSTASHSHSAAVR